MQDWLQALQETLSPWPWAYTAVMLALLLLLAWLANFITKKVLLRALRKALGMLPALHAEDAPAVQMRAVPRLANVVPALVIAGGIVLVPGLPDGIALLIRNLAQVFIVLTVVMAIGHVLDDINAIYERRPDARNKPIKGYLQVAKIVLYALAALITIAILAGVELLHVLTGLGAASAVLMLIFQDTILSFAASLQISSDGRVRIGDWIEMPSENADGDVIDIALHTVTVQNWDNTITTVPTKNLISHSFKNWRGMIESGGRRIKRALYIDQGSVRFLEPDEVENLHRFMLLDDYLRKKEQELREWNTQLAERGGDAPVNHRRVTNLGTFRVYVDQYLAKHPGIHQGMTSMVRQLQPTEAGIPLELYCFTNDVRWVYYEAIQSDIFDHLLAILPEFGLRVFQRTSDAPIDVRLHDQRSGAQGPRQADG
ncbi:mechanosensitive ion channel family protein [Luteimonas sp. JM171]|uniref:mechanosensitive ion channel family protein n=1 Tax=Luteimonas sp. JM171 TaxID=1896164 RepID=UPI0008571A75|nr:mechanosensitive ion channel domain-containing protein [Luteimonas sp. JM171]AOH35598.1 mechanosensitive ion channel protein MscS [Luteimonas sp. JM171]